MARTRNRQMKQAEAFVQASPKKIWKPVFIPEYL